ncbi:hypothetical protein [Lyngbya aestuarii]|uniref:hypothetical protein n=1 Tax=Lyngbya aestuarii TaxID=118322 RepID=UPI00403E1F4D
MIKSAKAQESGLGDLGICLISQTICSRSLPSAAVRSSTNHSKGINLKASYKSISTINSKRQAFD